MPKSNLVLGDLTRCGPMDQRIVHACNRVLSSLAHCLLFGSHFLSSCGACGIRGHAMHDLRGDGVQHVRGDGLKNLRGEGVQKLCHGSLSHAPNVGSWSRSRDTAGPKGAC